MMQSALKLRTCIVDFHLAAGTREELNDGSVMLPSNAWERKKTTCEEAKNKEILFHDNKGDVFLGSKGTFEARSTCGDSRKIFTDIACHSVHLSRPILCRTLWV